MLYFGVDAIVSGAAIPQFLFTKINFAFDFELAVNYYLRFLLNDDILSILSFWPLSLILS